MTAIHIATFALRQPHIGYGKGFQVFTNGDKLLCFKWFLWFLRKSSDG